MEYKLEILINRAIEKEEESYNFYMNLYATVNEAVAKDALSFLAGEEKKHKEFLIEYRKGKYTMNSLQMDEIIDYKIAQHIEIPDLVKNMETKDIYLVAAHRELNSHNFYKGLADVQPNGEVKDMLLRMAAEELRHKEKVEYLYANTAFPQTHGG